MISLDRFKALALRAGREPLVHFLILGLLIYGVAGRWIHQPPRGRIVVDAEDISRRHQQQTGSAPSPDTLANLIAQETERALLFREAQALSLGDGDEIVRRRLVQKMTLIIDEAVRPPKPSDDALRAFLDASPQTFARAPQVTLTHAFFRKNTDDAVVQDALRRLRAGDAPKSFGDPFPRGRTFGAVDERALAGIVGPAFARAVFGSNDADWFGPITSTYGLHLVRIERREPGRPAALEDVRRSVEMAWRARETERRRKQALKLLRDKYDVEIRGQ